MCLSQAHHGLPQRIFALSAPAIIDILKRSNKVFTVELVIGLEPTHQFDQGVFLQVWYLEDATYPVHVETAIRCVLAAPEFYGVPI